jgi:hypothetical protein
MTLRPKQRAVFAVLIILGILFLVLMFQIGGSVERPTLIRINSSIFEVPNEFSLTLERTRTNDNIYVYTVTNYSHGYIRVESDEASIFWIHPGDAQTPEVSALRFTHSLSGDVAIKARQEPSEFKSRIENALRNLSGKGELEIFRRKSWELWFVLPVVTNVVETHEFQVK